MISVVHQRDNRYEVYNSGMNIGCIAVSRNFFHAQHCYLKLGLTQYDPAIAKELFRLLRQELGSPLQVMLYASQNEQCEFLSAGGFQRKRRCYEIEVSASDLITPAAETVPLTIITKDDPFYQTCCKLLYSCYAKTHEKVSPLTADFHIFCRDLPVTVLCQRESANVIHFAFTEENEIAYTGTLCQRDFHHFAEALLCRMLRMYGSISFECDDCDPTAMELKGFFAIPERDSYDTYVLD